jgi:leucyl aminopeptidase
MLRLLSRKFYSSIPSTKYVSKSKKGKNLIYFATENDLKNNKAFDMLKNDRKLFLDDIKSTKSTLFYVPENSENYPCTERMLVVQTPLKDLFKIKGIVESSLNAFKQFKINEIDIKFSPSFPVHHRRLVLNASVLVSHENLEKGKTALRNFSPQESSLEKESKTNKKDEKEKTKVINIVEDQVILKNKNSLNLWINMAKGNLYTRNLANTRGSVGTPDYMHREAQNLADKFPDKITMTVMQGNKIYN